MIADIVPIDAFSLLWKLCLRKARLGASKDGAMVFLLSAKSTWKGYT